MFGKDNSLLPSSLQPFNAKWKFKPIWTKTISGKQTAGHLRLIPHVSNNIIYVATTDGSTAAIKAKNGDLLWQKQFSKGFTSGPSIKNNFLALGTANNELMVINQKSGKEIWHQSLSSALMAPPLLFSDKAVAKTMDGNVVAFSLQQGKKLWSLEHGSPQLILQASAGPVKMNSWILVPFSDGKVVALEPGTGHIVWEHEMVYPTGASDVERMVDIDSDLLVSDSIFYVASYQGELGAFSTTQGDFLWRKPIATFHNMVMNSQALFVVDNDSVVWAFNRQTGNVLWKQEVLKARRLTAPTIMGNLILVADKQGFLHGLSIATGEIEARIDLKSNIEVQPVVNGNHIYVMTLNGDLKTLTVQPV